MNEQLHKSVLLNECIEGLELKPNDVVVDATLGGAGHFGAILSHLDETGTLIGIDADEAAIERAQARAKGALATVHLVNDNFRTLDTILADLKIESVSKFIFDLGWSSFQLSGQRGFSFMTDEPLYMTYSDPSKGGQTAADIVNTATEDALTDIFFSYGEERFARNIAKGIVAARKDHHIVSTNDLAEIVKTSTPTWYHSKRTNPATKTFQALRIAVNDEFNALREGLASAITHLAPGGRIAVISFHSLEDRIVKTMFRDAAREGKGIVVDRTPISPSEAELKENPRARSAKLRLFEGLPVSARARESVYPYHAYV